MANEYYQQNPQTQQMPRHAQQYQQYQQSPQYQQYPPKQIYMQDRDSTTTGQWVLTLFLAAIPIVNIILMFVWAFSSNTETSKKNWARAMLIWALIGIVVAVILVAIATVVGIDVMQYLNNFYYSR